MRVKLLQQRTDRRIGVGRQTWAAQGVQGGRCCRLFGYSEIAPLTTTAQAFRQLDSGDEAAAQSGGRYSAMQAVHAGVGVPDATRSYVQARTTGVASLTSLVLE